MTRARIDSDGAIAATPRGTPGFSLIEMSVVLFVIVLLLGSILVPLHTQIEQRQVGDTEKTLEEIKETLFGFAITNGYLPCPDRTSGGAGTANDTANDGVEDFNTGTGACFGATAGNIPWLTLGLGAAATDAWGTRFRYRVGPEFAQRAPATPITLTSPANLTVCTTTACTTRLTSATGGEMAAAVVLSHGKNRYLGINASTGTAIACPGGGCSGDENENSGGSTYVSRVMTPLGSAAGEFDDIVIWISKYTLFNRMVAVGKLP